MSGNNSQEASETHERPKKEHTGNVQQKGKLRIRIRILPIWLRVIIVAVLLFLSAAAGAAIGYSVIGDGNAKDIFKQSTWTHIIDLVEKKQ